MVYECYKDDYDRAYFVPKADYTDDNYQKSAYMVYNEGPSNYPPVNSFESMIRYEKMRQLQQWNGIDINICHSILIFK